MEPWREQFFLTDIAGKVYPSYCESRKGRRKMAPLSLMSRFKSDKYKNCPLHFGVKAYLWALYGKCHGYIGNKGLYQPGDFNYKKAKKEENLKKINDHNETIKTKIRTLSRSY